MLGLLKKSKWYKHIHCWEFDSFPVLYDFLHLLKITTDDILFVIFYNHIQMLRHIMKKYY